MSKIRLLSLPILAIFALAGCRLFTPTAPTPTLPALPSMLPSATAAEPVATTISNTVTPLPLPTATSTPFVPVEGTITVDNFKLRKGPGFLFDAAALYKEGDSVQVYGRAQGDNWLFVTTNDSRSGWMKAEYIALSGELNDLPVIAYADADLVSGHVHNSHGDPMTSIGIIIFSASNSADSDNAVTDSSGSFYLFLPKNIRGNYTIGVNAYGCSSNAVDAQCQFLYGFPSAQAMILPNTAGVSVEFVLPDL